MMRSEWERAIKHNVTDEEWEVTHRVYQTHPLINEVNGKSDLLQIYKLGGFGLISSMLPDADAASVMEQNITNKASDIESLKKMVADAEASYLLYVKELAEFKASFVPVDR